MQRREVLGKCAGLVLVSSVAGCSSNNESTTTTGDEQDPNADRLDPEMVGEIVGNYKAGYEGVNSGIDLISTTLEAWNEDNNPGYAAALSGTEESMNNVAEGFSDAASEAAEINKSGIRKAATAGENEAKLLGDTARYMVDAANQASNGNRAEASNLLSKSQATMERAQEKHKQLLKPKEVADRVNYSGPV